MTKMKRELKILLLLEVLFFTVSITNYFHPIYIKPYDGRISKGNDHRLVLNAGKTLDTRGLVSGCTLADITKRPGVVLLTTTNTGFMDITVNMLESIKRTGVCVNITIIAEDEKAYQYLRRRVEADPAVHAVKTNFGVMYSEKLMVFSAKYKLLVNKRQQYILTFLERGLEVLFTDSDTFWFRDPFSYFQGDFDMSFVDERSPYPTRLPKKSLHCAGLGYFKPTNRTLQFVESWIRILLENKNKLPDQSVLNTLLHNDQPVHVNVKPLPLIHFPHALLFYKPKWRKENNDTIITHLVGIRGHDNKVNKLKESNMWLVNTTI